MKLLKQFVTQGAFALMFLVAFVSPALAGAGADGSFTQPTDGTNTFTKTTDSAKNIGVAQAGDPATNGAGGLIGAIKIAINRVLGPLALIALIICLWAGFKMLTAAGDAKAYGDGFTMLRQAGTGLIMIGISWLLVSFVFWVINIITNTQ